MYTSGCGCLAWNKRTKFCIQMVSLRQTKPWQLKSHQERLGITVLEDIVGIHAVLKESLPACIGVFKAQLHYRAWRHGARQLALQLGTEAFRYCDP